MRIRNGRHRAVRETIGIPTAAGMTQTMTEPVELNGISVLDHINAMLGQMDLRYQQRFDAQGAALSAALLAAEKAASTALITSEKAVLKAEAATENRLELLDELRSGVATIQQLEAVTLRINDIKERLDRLEGGRTGMGSLWGYALGAVGALAAIIATIALFR